MFTAIIRNARLTNDNSNRRLDNKLNIFEGITHNWFFIGINIIMIGGQILIIFIGSAAFQITRLNGMEWGLSVGLGAISIPWGILIRKFPDRWVAAPLPWFIRKRWAPETITQAKLEAHVRDTAEVGEHARPPLRSLSTLRGDRVRKNLRTGRGLRDYMHDQKVKAKVAVRKASVAAGVHGSPGDD